MDRLVPRILALLLILVAPMSVSAQGETAGADAAPESASADGVAPPPADEGPGFPAGLADPAIPLDELRLRLVPLTVEELTALADAWRANARDATLAVVERSLELREAGTRATEADRAAHADLLDARSLMFEKYGAVVASLEAKGGDPALIKDSLQHLPHAPFHGRGDGRTLEPHSEIAANVLAWLVSPPRAALQLALRVAVVLGALLGLLVAATHRPRLGAAPVSRRVPDLSKLLQGFLAMVGLLAGHRRWA